MTRVFVSNCDLTLGLRISKIFSATAPGTLHEEERDVEASSEIDENQAPGANAPEKKPYTVAGTLSTEKPVPLPHEDNPRAKDLPFLGAPTGPRIGEQAKWVNEIVRDNSEGKEVLAEALLNSDVIVYDALRSLDEATWALEFLNSQRERFEDKPKTFILLSTVMTWSRTKVDPDDPDTPFTEDDYRRRKPHPNFRNHTAVEKIAIKYGKKPGLRTYVVAPGLIYGGGESIFHFLFKAAWSGDKELLVFGDGENIVPTIHVDDLARIVLEIAETLPEQKYVVAVDESKHTLGEIVTAIAEQIGQGATRKISKEEALLIRDLPQADYDMLLVNLRMDPILVKDMGFEWKSENGLIETLQSVFNEYKEVRGLSAINIVIHGPPAVGKTLLASKVAEFYGLHHIKIEDTINKAIENLEASAAHVGIPDGNEEKEAEREADRELLEELRESARQNGGRYPEENVISFLRQQLKSSPCRNQGYVLDGYPKRAEEASPLFKSSNDEDADTEEAGPPAVDQAIVPSFVFSLDASDDFIKERVMSLPESEVVGTKYSEEELTRRLEKFRGINTEENTVLNYFDELEIHPVVLRLDQMALDEALGQIKKIVGRPHNYGPSPAELAEMKRIADEEAQRQAAIAAEERERKEKEENERHAKAVSEWNARLQEVRKQEQEVLDAQSIPLREYLMRHVMPTLAEALIEVCKVRPDDPVDYLAEFLFKNNPANA